MKRILIIGISLLIIGQASGLQASVEAVDIVIKRLVEKQLITAEEAEELRTEIAASEKDKEAARKSKSVTASIPLKISGYVQQRYINSQAANANDSLEARRVRLNLSGDVSPELDYRVQVDFAGSRAAVTNANTNATALFGRPLLVDAHVGWKLPGGQKVTVGQFKVPSGLENLTSSTALDTINRTEGTERLSAGRDIGAQGRDVGIQLSGQTPTTSGSSVQYWVGLFNGNGINQGDDNGRKDLAGRVLWRTPAQGLNLAVTHYNGARGSQHAKRERSSIETTWAGLPPKEWTPYNGNRKGVQVNDKLYTGVSGRVGAAGSGEWPDRGRSSP